MPAPRRRGNQLAWAAAVLALVASVSWDAWAPLLLDRWADEPAPGTAQPLHRPPARP